MSVVGDFTIPTQAFALEQALVTVPEMTVRADSLVSHSPQEVFPFLWAKGGDFEQFKQSMVEDPTVTEVNIAEETDEEVLYRLRWADEFCNLIHEIVDHHAAILQAKAHDDHWELRLRFSEEEMVSEFQNHFQETGHSFEVNQLYHPNEPRQRVFGLTTDQYDALVEAANQGYFSIPRTVSVQELGDSLGVSANAVSQRVRRGCETLIQSSLLLSDETE